MNRLNDTKDEWFDTMTEEEARGTQHTPDLCNIETMLAGKGCTVVVGPGAAFLIDNSGENPPQSMSDLDIDRQNAIIATVDVQGTNVQHTYTLGDALTWIADLVATIDDLVQRIPSDDLTEQINELDRTNNLARRFLTEIEAQS